MSTWWFPFPAITICHHWNIHFTGKTDCMKVVFQIHSLNLIENKLHYHSLLLLGSPTVSNFAHVMRAQPERGKTDRKTYGWSCSQISPMSPCDFDLQDKNFPCYWQQAVDIVKNLNLNCSSAAIQIQIHYSVNTIQSYLPQITVVPTATDTTMAPLAS